MIDCVVSPVDHTLSAADEDVRITESPAQNVKGPLAEIVGVAGTGFTVTVSTVELPDVQPLVITSTA